MAGTATHLAIADKLYSILGDDKIKNPALFYSGNIAPDAIHARANYQRSYKKRTHMTEGISGGDFQNQEKLAVYYDRVNEFTRKYYLPNHSDLYLGYIVHLITDELFNIYIRQRFVISMKSEGIEQGDPEFFNRIIKDIESVDCIIIKRYPYNQNLRDLLNEVWDYEITDYITADELNRSKHWVIDTYINYSGEEPKPQYYSYEAACDFIDFAADNIVTRLTNGTDYLKLI